MNGREKKRRSWFPLMYIPRYYSGQWSTQFWIAGQWLAMISLMNGIKLMFRVLSCVCLLYIVSQRSAWLNEWIEKGVMSCGSNILQKLHFCLLQMLTRKLKEGSTDDFVILLLKINCVFQMSCCTFICIK